MLKSIKVRDYMTTQLVTFQPETDIFKAISTLKEHRISGAPVLDHNGQLVGILTEGDCLTAIIKDIYYTEAGGKVGDFMTTEVSTIGPDDDIVDVAVEFQKQRRKRFPVIEDGELVGQISQRDILRAVLDIAQHPEHG
ncbi:MAG: CBS domain-containing protein [Pseudomonadales bacterium]|jgi:CBS domain-containing protein